MICKKCNTDFDVDMYGTRCPNCNSDNPLQSFDNAADATKYVIALYGKEILKNGKKFYGIINDIIPHLIKEKNMFLHMYKENIFSILYNADGKNSSDKKMAMIVSARRLIDNVGFSEQTAVNAIEYITSALNWNIKLDVNSLKSSNTPTTVKNVSATTPPVSKTKTSVKKWNKKKIAVCFISTVLTIGVFGIAVFNTMKKDMDYAASDEYMGEEEQLFEDEYSEEDSSFDEKNSKEESNEEIIYSDTKTYKNSYFETNKKASGFKEELTISTKNKTTKFSNGVEFSLISDNSDNDTLRLVYEVYNPNDHPIVINDDGSIVYNKNNEIVEREPYLFPVYNEIIFPNSSIVLEIEEYFSTLNVIRVELGRIETKVKVENANVEPVKNISISNVEFSGDYVSYKVKTGEIQAKEVAYQISFLDKKGEIVAYSDASYQELFSNTTELKEKKVLFTGNDNPIEKIVFYAYYM